MRAVIFTFLFNNFHFLRIQVDTLRKFVVHPFELVVFNDANEEYYIQRIDEECQKLGILSIRVDQSIHKNQNPSLSYGNTTTWALQEYAFKSSRELGAIDIVCLIHADIFPLQNIDLIQLLGDNAFFSAIDGRNGNYHICPSFTIIKCKSISAPEDFSLRLCTIDGVNYDTGGESLHYIRKYNPKHYLFDTGCSYVDVSPTVERFLEETQRICIKHRIKCGWYCYGMYHYICGSLWDKPRFPYERDSKWRYTNIDEDVTNNAIVKIQRWYRKIRFDRYSLGNLRRVLSIKKFLYK